MGTSSQLVDRWIISGELDDELATMEGYILAKPDNMAPSIRVQELRDATRRHMCVMVLQNYGINILGTLTDKATRLSSFKNVLADHMEQGFLRTNVWNLLKIIDRHEGIEGFEKTYGLQEEE